MSKHRKLGRVCSACPAGIIDKSTTGMCKPCFMRTINGDPEVSRRRSQSLKRLCAPGGKLHKKKCEILAEARRARDTEGLRERGKLLAANFPAHAEKRRKAHAEAMRKRRHQWLPDEWRELYKTLLRSRGYKAPEAKALILEHIELQKQRRRREREARLAARRERRRIWEEARGDLPEEKDTIRAVVDAAVASRRLLEALQGAAR